MKLKKQSGITQVKVLRLLALRGWSLKAMQGALTMSLTRNWLGNYTLSRPGFYVGIPEWEFNGLTEVEGHREFECKLKAAK